MATLTNTQISVTYVGLLKTSGNTILDSTPQQVTDGSGNNSQLFLSTTKVGVGATPSGSDTLQITGTSLTQGLTKMWEWAQTQPNRDRFVWDKYEIEKGIYSFWKNDKSNNTNLPKSEVSGYLS